jgi:hypothetical protein
VHEEILRQRAHKEAQLKEAALEKLAEELKNVSLTIGAKTSTKGKIFGSVNTIQIAEALTEKGFETRTKEHFHQGRPDQGDRQLFCHRETAQRSAGGYPFRDRIRVKEIPCNEKTVRDARRFFLFQIQP